MKTGCHNVAGRMIIKALSRSPWGAGLVNIDMKSNDRFAQHDLSYLDLPKDIMASVGKKRFTLAVRLSLKGESPPTTPTNRGHLFSPQPQGINPCKRPPCLSTRVTRLLKRFPRKNSMVLQPARNRGFQVRGEGGAGRGRKSSLTPFQKGIDWHGNQHACTSAKIRDTLTRHRVGDATAAPNSPPATAAPAALAAAAAAAASGAAAAAVPPRAAHSPAHHCGAACCGPSPCLACCSGSTASAKATCCRLVPDDLRRANKQRNGF
eukprot:1153825-Pelagomonas_calceolata.AAC.1